MNRNLISMLGLKGFLTPFSLLSRLIEISVNAAGYSFYNMIDIPTGIKLRKQMKKKSKSSRNKNSLQKSLIYTTSLF